MIDITSPMLESLIANLKLQKSIKTNLAKSQPIPTGINAATRALIGIPQETPVEIAKLQAALSVLSSDVGYGTGSFYDHNSNPRTDYWLAGIWAIASLNWSGGKDIAREWSKQSPRYDDDGFEKAWNSYDTLHPNAIGIGSLYKRAKELGFVTNSTTQSQNASNVASPLFTLLGINDLAALPPTEHLIKGILPTTGLAAIYGPSGSGKTFLALDLMMTVACQQDWFEHKVKNAPVTYIGLEGKGGIKNRIQAWRVKNPSFTPTNFKVILNNFDLMKQFEVDALAQAIISNEMHQGLIVIDTLNQASPSADENSSQDMGTIIKHLKHLQEATGGLVLIVHHTGKNTAQGLRGHSSLKAALDANIEVIGGDKKSWVLEKSKDGEDGKSFGFRLEVHELGIDSDGDQITSCTVERDHSLIFAKPEPSGSQQKLAFKAVKQALANSSNQKLTAEDCVTAIANTLTAIQSNKRNNRARQILSTLTANGFLSSTLIDDVGWVWLP
jgi:archaellum biogenesis ATPase FlaH